MKLIEDFLALTRLGIGHYTGRVLDNIDWPAIKALADKHGLSAIVLDGIEKLPLGKRPPKDFTLQWIGEVLQNYESRYEMYKRAIADLAGFYNSFGYKMMVLKGYSCSLDWPKPKHRPCGDIDIWIFGKQKEADAKLEQEKGIKIDKSHHHHTVFYWREFMVENHYDFINVHHHKSNARLEKMLKELGKDDNHYVALLGEKVFLPSPDLHALFLLRHAMGEFAATGINVRQIIDWAFFAEKHTKEINWEWLNEVLAQYHMKDFVNCINAICVEDLGFDSYIFTAFQFNPYVKDRVMSDILCPKIPNVKPQNLLIRAVWKLRRWKANQWKHELCYNESMWSAFWSGVWGHLLKPKSI